MQPNEHQQELQRAYVRGGPGAIVSGIVWFAAGTTADYSGIETGFVVLFFGGMLIFPVSKLLLKLFFSREPESKENPGGLIVIETVFPMIGCLFAAWLLLPHRPDWAFSVAAIAVGAHYFGFRAAYGDWTYWALGAAMCLVGTASIYLGLPPHEFVPYIIAAVEVGFGVWFVLADRAARPNAMT